MRPFQHHPQPGETATGASIITLPPPGEWQSIHPKSMPLMLPVEDGRTLDAWLNSGTEQVEQFRNLLQPVIRQPQLITPIGRPGKWDRQKEAFRIDAGSS